MTAANSNRRRGLVLTVVGAQKLQAARHAAEQAQNFGQRYTKEELATMLGLSHKTISKIFTRGVITTVSEFPIDKQSLELCFAYFNLTLERQDYLYPDRGAGGTGRATNPGSVTHPHRLCNNLSFDCGEAPDVKIFYGRERELAQLTCWVEVDRCRTIEILGMGGIGKTALVTKLARQLQPGFTAIAWRSLRNAPPLAKLLPKLIEIYSHQAEIVPQTMNISDQISCLIHYFQQERCLLVFDNVETIVQLEAIAPQEYLGYSELFQRIGQTQHQSCLLITSRERVAALVPWEGVRLPLRTLRLPGLDTDDSQGLFDARGLSTARASRSRLVEKYSGNPLALSIVATTICDLFDRDIDEFLADEVTIFSDIRQLLERQFERLDRVEQAVMYWLAIARESITLTDLHPQIAPAIAKSQVLTAIESLSRKSLIEHQGGKFTQQTVVMEYTIVRAIELVVAELTSADVTIGAGNLPLWLSHAWLDLHAPEYIQAIQRRSILGQIASQLELQFRHRTVLVEHLRSLLTQAKTHDRGIAHYGGGNIINLFRYLAVDLTGSDFSNLAMWQADFQGAILHDVNLSGTDLSRSQFTQNFGGIFTLAFSADSQLLVMGLYSGDLLLWDVKTKQLQAKLSCPSWIWAIAFSPDGRILASASQDAIVRLWDVKTGTLRYTLPAEHHVLSIGYSPDGRTLATANGDGKVRFWDVATGTQQGILAAHAREACSVRYSPDGRWLATSSQDPDVKIWDVSTGTCVQTLSGHTQRIWAVRFSPDGKWLATGSGDGTIKLWDVESWQVRQVLTGYRNWLFSICFSPDSRLLLTAIDSNVRIWDIATQQQVGTLRGHPTGISSIQFSPDGKVVATSGNDRSVRLWHPQTWQELYRWQGYTSWVESVVFHPDGQRLLSSGQDALVRVWEIATGTVLRTFAGDDRFGGHDLYIWSVDYSPDGRSIASGGADRTVKLWDAESGRLIQTYSTPQGDVRRVRFSPDGRLLAGVGMDDSNIYLWSVTGESLATLGGGASLVRSIAFSPDSKLLAAAGFDAGWRLWDVATGELVGYYTGHTNWIWDLAFSPDGKLVATCSDDRTVNLWDIATGEIVRTLTGHALEVIAVEFSPDGRQLATSSSDRSIKIWEVETGMVLATLTGHQERILTLSYSPDGRRLASGSADETIKLWDLTTGACLRTCRLYPPYLGLNISGATGLTPATIASLKTLGAIEQSIGTLCVI
jgi:WD40 repeat protein/DNA-binding XRE family transcriptional regulator